MSTGEIIDYIKAGKFSLKGKEWMDVSDSAKNLIEGMCLGLSEKSGVQFTRITKETTTIATTNCLLVRTNISLSMCMYFNIKVYCYSRIAYVEDRKYLSLGVL